MDWKLLFILGLVLALVTACGEVTPEDTVEAGEEGTIKIGMLMALTGDVATLGIPLLEATKMAVEEVNAAGGIRGQMVEIIDEDSRCQSLRSAAWAGH